ncbi:hypothetical protein EMIT0P12_10494 [Pseudomonas sp. IT-P12]
MLLEPAVALRTCVKPSVDCMLGMAFCYISPSHDFEAQNEETHRYRCCSFFADRVRWPGLEGHGLNRRVH